MFNRVLFITNHYLNGNGGGVYASRAYINAFANFSDSVDLLYPDNGVIINDSLKSNVNCIGFKDSRSIFRKGLDVIRGRLHRYDQGLLNSYLDNSYDLIVLDNGVLGDLACGLRAICQRIITIHHNVQIDFYKDNTKSNILFKTIYSHYLYRNEKSALESSMINLCLTETDKSRLQKVYKLNKEVSIDVSGCFEFEEREICSLSSKNNQYPRFLITGNLSAIQTTCSLNVFLSDYYSILSEVFPYSELFIAGKNPSPSFKAIVLGYKRIKLIENPVDMNSIIRESDIYICPISMGSGIKLRVMDGLRFGLPVISHNVSIRGYEEFVNSNQVIAYSDFLSFKKALIYIKENTCVYNNPKNNQLMFSDKFSFNSGVNRVESIINKYIK